MCQLCSQKRFTHKFTTATQKTGYQSLLLLKVRAEKQIRPFIFGRSYVSTILIRDLLTFRQSSCSCHAVVSSCQQLSLSCHLVVTQLSGSLQAVVSQCRQLSDSGQKIMRQLYGSHQAVVTSHQEAIKVVIRQTSNCDLHVKNHTT